MLNGIDISSYQGDINLAALQGVDFVIVKTTEGTDYINPYAYKADEALAQGKLLGFYHFASTGNSASAEADYFIDNSPYFGRGIPVLDFEADAIINGTKWVVDFAERVHERTGVWPMFYSYQSHIAQVSYESIANRCPLWVASYPNVLRPGLDYTAPITFSLGSWSSATVWQYASDGCVGGYDGEIDVNHAYVSREAWEAYARGDGLEVEANPKPNHSMGEYAVMCGEHFVEHNESHGYSQGSNRWGNGIMEDVTLDDIVVRVAGGDRDCASLAISIWEALGVSCGGATYTGDMRQCMTATGNFAWELPSFVASPGDLYLNELSHVAMCKQQVPDEMIEALINEFGDIVGGAEGDQTGNEITISPYRDFADGILHYVGGDACVPQPQPTTTPELRYRVSVDPTGNAWLPEMVDHYDPTGSGDDFAGNGQPIRWLAISMMGWYQVQTERSGWLPQVRGYNTADLLNGCAGDGSPILAVRCYYETQHPEVTGWLAIEYQVDGPGGYLAAMRDLTDSSGSGDDFAGNGQPITKFRARLVSVS